MDGTRATSLLSCPLEQTQDAEMPEHLCHGDLLAQVCKIYFGSRDGGCLGSIDTCGDGLYAASSRGDHLLCRDFIPFVAHGFAVAGLRFQGCYEGGGRYFAE